MITIKAHGFHCQVMAQTTTIPIDPDVRDRLRGFGTAGMTYSEILTQVLDKIEREAFIRDLQRQANDPSVRWVDIDDVDWNE
jgi:hypothetical protein